MCASASSCSRSTRASNLLGQCDIECHQAHKCISPLHHFSHPVFLFVVMSGFTSVMGLHLAFTPMCSVLLCHYHWTSKVIGKRHRKFHVAKTTTPSPERICGALGAFWLGVKMYAQFKPGGGGLLTPQTDIVYESSYPHAYTLCQVSSATLPEAVSVVVFMVVFLFSIAPLAFIVREFPTAYGARRIRTARAAGGRSTRSRSPSDDGRR
jgi:hypothetical protein